MSVKIKTVKTKFPEMIKISEAIDGTKINVGVKGEQAWLASIHEYGCKIQVTPKMRAWLHANGLHIKSSTTQIVIPERSFLRTGYDKSKDDVIKSAERVLPLVLDGRMPEEQLYNLVGELLRDNIKDYATSLKTPPNHSFTIERKGSSNPLVQSGDMINAIEYEVTK